jgi:hypothetical protein
MREFKLKGTNKDSVLKYSDKKYADSKMTNSFNIYLFDWCDKEKQDNFISAFERITELSKQE